MAETSHRSIGEVLNLLKQEHPDVTISKIRFLESQGLISPERTPSGYRKFYEADVDRLRWILEQQRDNFLPLKVIKRRLDSGDPGAVAERAHIVEPPREPTLFSRRDDTSVEATVATGEPDPPPSRPGAATDTPEPSRSGRLKVGDAGSVSLTTRELADATGVDTIFIDEIRRLGLIAPISSSDEFIYDHEALIVAKAAATFGRRGLEPRHLRTFKVAAERQAGLFEQLLGVQAQRGPDAAAEARTELDQLVALGEVIQRSVMHRNLGHHLRQP